jgi:hypothetical protein
VVAVRRSGAGHGDDGDSVALDRVAGHPDVVGSGPQDSETVVAAVAFAVRPVGADGGIRSELPPLTPALALVAFPGGERDRTDQHSDGSADWTDDHGALRGVVRFVVVRRCRGGGGPLRGERARRRA